MSRKSRRHASEKRRKALREQVALLVLASLCLLAGAALIWTAYNTPTLDRKDALPVEATFRQAVEEWRPRNRKQLRYYQTGLYLQFSDHADMEIPFNWDDVAVAEKLHYTDKRERPVLLADLQPGAVCTMLADPQEPSRILHLETAEGTVVISFEASMDAAMHLRKHRWIIGGALVGTGVVGGLWTLSKYLRLRRKFYGKG